MSWRSSTSTPAVGSSRNRTCGSCASAFAIMTRRFMPPDSVMILLSFLSHSDSERSTFSQYAAFFGLPNRPRLNIVVSQTVSNASVASSCGTRPIRSRAARAFFADVVTVDGDRAAARVDDAADDVDQRRLAGAVRAEQTENLAAPDLEIRVLQRLEAGRIGLRQILDRDDRLHEALRGGALMIWIVHAMTSRSARRGAGCYGR